MMNTPSGGGGPVIAVIGSVPSGPQAGDPEIAVPMGYTPTQRRNIAVDVNGGAYDDLDLLGVSYVIEQGTMLREAPGEINPSAYRCAHTATAEPFAEREHCNPDYQSLMAMLGGTPTVLPFALETTSAAELEEKMEAGTLTAVELVKAELYRAARTNSDGPSVRSIAAIAPDAIAAAEEADATRAKLKGESKTVPALTGIPVLVDNSIDVEGLATSAGSIALQDNVASESAPLVEELEKQGAIILGDTNTTELGGAMEGTNMPRGYSSLGGEVLLPSNTNVQTGGSSGGSAGAVSMGLAPLAVGMESSLEAAQLIAPAGNAGVVGLKPTLGLISSAGVLPVAKSQDSPGPIAQTVKDAAIALEALSGQAGTNKYTAGLTPNALFTASMSVIPMKEPAARSLAEQLYVTTENTANSLGANLVRVTPGAAVAAPSVVPFELHRDLDSYLAAAGDPEAESLEEIIEYNEDNPEEGLKFGQKGLEAAAAVDVEDPTTEATYEANLESRQGTGRCPARRRARWSLRADDPGDGHRIDEAPRSRRPRRLPGADVAGGIRGAGQLDRRRSDRDRPDRRQRRRGGTARRRLRARTGSEGPPARAGIHAGGEPDRLRRAERDQPEHVPLHRRQRLLQALRLQPRRTGHVLAGDRLRRQAAKLRPGARAAAARRAVRAPARRPRPLRSSRRSRA